MTSFRGEPSCVYCSPWLRLPIAARERTRRSRRTGSFVSDGAETSDQESERETHLSRMHGQAVTEFGSDLTRGCEYIRRERLETISMNRVARKREHLRAETHELDAVFFVPLKHLNDISHIRESDFLKVLLPKSHTHSLRFIRPIVC